MFYRCFLPVCTFKSAAIFTLSPMGLSNISKKGWRTGTRYLFHGDRALPAPENHCCVPKTVESSRKSPICKKQRVLPQIPLKASLLPKPAL
jgi:hypothetical protein